MPDQMPSVGRVVHYVSYGSPVRPDGTQAFRSLCRAAIVTDASPTSRVVGLVALNPTGLFFHALEDGGCAQDEDGHAGGTWHWPERI
jgi:hypothetical protein